MDRVHLLVEGRQLFLLPPPSLARGLTGNALCNVVCLGQLPQEPWANVLRDDAFPNTLFAVIIALTIPNQPCHRAFPVCILHIFCLHQLAGVLARDTLRGAAIILRDLTQPRQ